MQEHEDHTPEEGVEPPADEAPGSGAEAPGPEPHSEEAAELTVDDILGAAPEDADVPEEEQPSSEKNPYLEDLRRITAEFANYRKRTEANRELEVQRATAKVIEPLLDVLDDLDRADAHGDLEPGTAFHTIAQKIRTT